MAYRLTCGMGPREMMDLKGVRSFKGNVDPGFFLLGTWLMGSITCSCSDATTLPQFQKQWGSGA